MFVNCVVKLLKRLLIRANKRKVLLSTSKVIFIKLFKEASTFSDISSGLISQVSPTKFVFEQLHLGLLLTK